MNTINPYGAGLIQNRLYVQPQQGFQPSLDPMQTQSSLSSAVADPASANNSAAPMPRQTESSPIPMPRQIDPNNPTANPSTGTPTYSSMLSGYVKDPNSFTTDPGYQFQLNQGLEDVQRRMSAAGLGVSGNQMAALQNYGSGLAAQQYNTRVGQLSGLSGQQFGMAQATDQASQGFYNDRFNQLAQLSGVGMGSPGTSAQLLQNQQAGSSAAMQNLGSGLWNSFGGMFNSNAGGNAGGNGQGMPVTTDNSTVGSAWGDSNGYGGDTSSPTFSDYNWG